MTEKQRLHDFLIDTQAEALQIIEQYIIDYVPKAQLEDLNDLLFERWEAREKLKEYEAED